MTLHTYKVKASRELLAMLAEYAEIMRPSEACGVVAFEPPAVQGWRARRFVPMSNRHPVPSHGFKFDDRELAMITQLYRSTYFLGVFHSHVETTAEPSCVDREAMRRSDRPFDAPWLIHGVDGLRAWPPYVDEPGSIEFPIRVLAV